MIRVLGDRKNVIIALSVVTIVGLFAYVLLKTQKDGTLIIKSGDSEMKMVFSSTNIELRQFMNQLFADELRKKETLAIFRGLYNLYEHNDPHLIFSFRNEGGESGLSQSIRELLFELRGPFQRQYHTYYDIDKISVIDALIALGHEHPVAERLRELRDNYQGMFEERGIEAYVSLDNDGAITDGHAAVCVGSKFRGRDLLILNPTNEVTISVLVSKSFLCHHNRGNRHSVDEIQVIKINHNDGQKLFAGKKPENEEHVIIYPAPTGYMIKPQIISMMVAN
jgi:hypothetical protein